MAFQNLRTGSTVYAFTKSNSPQFEIGQVIADPEIHAKYPQQGISPGQVYNPPSFMPPAPQEQVVKLTIRFGEKIQPIDRLTPTADIQDCGNGLFISCSRDAINAEVLSYKQISDNALAPQVLETHKQISSKCAEIINQLNPEIAERQRLEAENKKLREELSVIKSETSEMKGMLSDLLAQLGSPKA